MTRSAKTVSRKPSPVPGSPEWFALRRSGIGATDAANILGRSDYGSPWTKYQEMTGLTVPKVATEVMEWGIKLQPLVARKWSEATGKRIRACNYTYWHPSIDRVFAHYDYDVPPGAILEVKTTGLMRADEWGEEDSDQVPEEYLLQAQHELMCRPDRTVCHVAVLIGGQRFRKYVVPRDRELIMLMEDRYRDFLDRVDRGEPPEIDGSRAATEYLAHLYPTDNGEEIELDETAENLATRYLNLREQKKLAAASLDAVANGLRDWMAERALARGGGYTITYRQERDQTVVDWPEIAKEVPDLVARHTRTEPGRRPLFVRFKAP
jgi:putative phage-type endonuclease